jgi:hypothetical protein
VVESVEERHDDRTLHSGLGYTLERLGQLGRLCCDPDHVHRLPECRRGRELGVEVPEQGALDADDAAASGERLLAHQQENVAARAGEGSAEKGTDAAGAEDGVSHHSGSFAASALSRDYLGVPS